MYSNASLNGQYAFSMSGESPSSPGGNPISRIGSFVADGNGVITSGMDRIFPRDLPVGTVAEIKSGNPFKQIRIKPAANLERLEEVLVLLSLRPLEMKNEGNTGDPPPAPGAANPPRAAKR